MKNNSCFIFSVVTVVVATILFGASCASISGPSFQITEKRWRWRDPEAETTWKEIIQSSNRNSLQPRMKNVDVSQAEGQLEAFGLRYMPNTYAHYQEVRTKALELEQVLKEHFPKGNASDPTGGTMFKKATTNLQAAVAQTFRRRDELCFFLLFHQAGLFSEDRLADYDAQPISIRLEPELADWPDDTPKADTALTAEDATFAAKYLPETFAGYQRLCRLFEEGAKQYADLRRMALTLDAPRARNEFVMLKIRLLKIQATLQKLKNEFPVQRISHTLGEITFENLAKQDQPNAAEIQTFEQEMELMAYISWAARRISLVLTWSSGLTMEMVWCPPGMFMMGSPPDEEGHKSDEFLHPVTLTRGFFMAKTEVTYKQWKSVMGYYPDTKDVLEVSLRWGCDRQPVDCVTWSEAQLFCRKAALQLPTEAEWEYACRAGAAGPYAGCGRLNQMGWYNYRGDGYFPVGKQKANDWGLYDMHGNVWEWCADWYGNYPHGAVIDPQGPNSGEYRVLRGGGRGDRAQDCRSANRSQGSPDFQNHNCGFRPVLHMD